MIFRESRVGIAHRMRWAMPTLPGCRGRLESLPHGRRFRPTLEPLENRCLLSLVTLVSSDTPLNIPDFPAAGIVSTLDVNFPGIIRDVDVTLNIRHNWDEDVEVHLVGPDNTRIRLFDDVGGSGDNFTGTILDDEAAVAIGPLTASSNAPFTGRFRPEQALSVFDGKSLQGAWKLEVADDEAIIAGVLDSWSLTFDYVNLVLVGPETLVNTFTAGSQTTFTENKLSVAADAAGNSVVVWTSTGQDEGGTRGVYAQRFDAAGNRLGAEFRVNTVTANDQSTPAVAMAESGAFVIVWRSVGQEAGGAANSNGVFARLYDAAGEPRGPEFQVNTTIADTQTLPTVAMTATGSFIVAWQSGTSSTYDIFVRRYDSGGVAQSGEIAVNTITAGAQTNPAVAVDAAGNFVVAWHGPGTGLDVYARRFDAAGTPREAAEFRVNAFTSNDQERPSVAMAPSGDFVIAWESFGQESSGSAAVYVRRFNAAGVAQGSGDERVNTHAPNQQRRAVVDTDAAGNFLVTWSSLGQDSSGGWGIYGQRFDASGTRLGSEFRINTTTSGDQESASLALSGDGRHMVIVWSGAAFEDDDGVFGQWFFDGDVPATVEQAQPLRVLEDDSVFQASVIEAAGDEDMYRYVATVSGLVKLDLRAADGSSLDPIVYLYNAAGQQEDSDDDGGPGRNSQLTFHAIEGETYYIKAGAFGTSTGAYELLITPMPDLIAEVFDVVQVGAQWGATVRLDYRIRNQGSADAGAAWVVAVLSTDATLETTSAPGNFLFNTQATRIVPLGPGGSFTNSFEITLPDAPPAGFSATGPLFLGIIVDFSNEVIELNGGNNQSIDSLTILADNEVEGNNDATQANSIAANTTVNGSIDQAGDVDWYQFEVATAGYFDAEVNRTGGSNLDSRLSVLGVESLLTSNGLSLGGGGLLLSSDDQATGNIDPRIRMYLLPGKYLLSVSSAATTAATGAYRLTVQFTADDVNPHATNAVRELSVGMNPRGLVTADFNRDRILDLATVNANSGDVSILLGLGDGNFHNELRFDVPDAPEHIFALDWNGDGRVDLVTIDVSAGFVSLLPGVGDGSFLSGSAQRLRLDDAALPAVVRERIVNPLQIPDGTAEFTGFGLTIEEDLVIQDLDIVLDVTHESDADLDVFLVGPDGARVQLFADVTLARTAGFLLGVSHDFRNVTFDDEAPQAITDTPERTRLQPQQALSVFDGQSARGRWTLEVRDDEAGGEGQLLSWGLVINGHRVFTSFSLAVSNFDFNGDHTADQAALVPLASGQNDSRVRVEVVAPVNDGLVVSNLVVIPEDFAINFDLGPQNPRLETLFAGSLFGLSSDRTLSDLTQATPLFADLTGDEIWDVVQVRANGDIVLRAGVAGSIGRYEAPLIINANQPAARAVAIVQDGTSPLLAAIDALTNSVSLYRREGGVWQRTAGLDTGVLPIRIAAGDLDGDGRTDLVVANAAYATLSFFLAESDGGFRALPQLQVGQHLSDMALSDLNGDGALDVTLSDPNSGMVSVLINRDLPLTPSPSPPGGEGKGVGGELEFSAERRFRAGTGDYGVAEGISTAANNALEDLYGLIDYFPAQYFAVSDHATNAVIAADFNRDGVPDLAAANRGSGTFSLLYGKRDSAGITGSYADAVTFAVGHNPIAIRAADVNGDDYLDVVVLGSDGTLSIFLNQVFGGFELQPVRPSAGNAPTGLTLLDHTGDGIVDAVIGNTFGDLLVLTGNGDGTFNPYRRTGQHVAMAVLDLDGDGADDIVYGNESLDRVAIRYGTDAKEVFQDRDDGLLAPGAVELADLNGDGVSDLLVANSGGASLFVYPGLGDGQFGAPVEFFVGTNPAGITVADLNDDQRLDVITANEGSNDISVLLGQGEAASWTLAPGIRLDTGAGPVATVVQDITLDGIPDILVSNSQAGTVTQLNGLGNGFFNDQTATTLPVGLFPGDLFVGNFDGAGGLDLAVINAGSNNVTLIANFTVNPTVFIASSGGSRPVAGLASDFDGNGILDLAVANNADGVISLLLGGETGFSLHQTLNSNSNPTALALANENGELYVGHEGEEVVRLAFNLGFEEPTGDPAGGAERVQITLLSPVQGGGLAVVVSLRTGGDEMTVLGPEAEVNPEALSVLVLFLGDAAPKPEAAEEDAEDVWSKLYEDTREVVDFIIGLRETEERLRDENQERLNGPASAAQVLRDWLSALDQAIREAGVDLALWIENAVPKLENSHWEIVPGMLQASPFPACNILLPAPHPFPLSHGGRGERRERPARTISSSGRVLSPALEVALFLAAAYIHGNSTRQQEQRRQG